MEIIPAWEVVQEQLERFGRSEQFSRSKRLMRFLRFTIEKTFSGDQDELTEHGIGVGVYDRVPDFDPNVDGIVRVEARRLRTKLEEYYRESGRQDSLVIEYPLGSYVPSFRIREADFLPLDRRMAERIRSLDWGQTSLGPLLNWPRNLKIALGMCLRAQIPQAILWGAERIVFYNDALDKLIGPAYQEVLGKPGADVALEAVPGLTSILRKGLGKDEAGTLPNERTLIQRDGYREENYLTISYSPVIGGDWEISGVLFIVSDTTLIVLAERRLKTLNDLSAQGVPPANAVDACRFVASVLQHNPYDIPFASIYLFEEDRKGARLQGTAGVEPGSVVSPHRIPLGDETWTLLAEAAATGTNQVLEVQGRLGALPSGAWQIPPNEVVVLPLYVPNQTLAAGFIVAGINPHRKLDQEYRTFFESIATRCSDMIGRARRLEDEKTRQAEWTDLQHKRISFLSVAGDELRTPLTILLGLLSSEIDDSQFPAPHRSQIKMARRNVLRLLKLVDGLAAFARLQIGQVDTAFEPVDLSAVMAEIAAMLRPAIERAGLRFTVDFPPLGEEVYVDRLLWEEIILSLIVSAYKKTLQGEIGMMLRPTGAWIEIVVWDTGEGIAASQLPHVFEPFHHTAASLGRMQEGGDLGLALAREFLKLHGGEISVQSEEEKGTRFSLLLPRGKSHLPPNRVVPARGTGPAAPSLRSYVEEVLRWTPERTLPVGQPADLAPAQEGSAEWHQRALVGPTGGRVVVAAPDSDLRHYVKYLLSDLFTVDTAADGVETMAALRSGHADLLIVDAATPKANGTELLRTIRADMALQSLPIIVMSGSKSEKDRLRALASGADDYLVKPFTARELTVRAQSQIALAELRKAAAETEHKLRTEAESQKALLEAVLDRIPTALMLLAVPSGAIIRANTPMQQLFGDALDLFTNVETYPEGIVLHADGRPCMRDDCSLVRAVRFGEVISNEEIIVPSPSGAQQHFKVDCRHVRDRDGKIVAVVVALQDVTEFAIAKAARS